jgi:hypothetical protein
MSDLSVLYISSAAVLIVAIWAVSYIIVFKGEPKC